MYINACQCEYTVFYDLLAEFFKVLTITNQLVYIYSGQSNWITV